MKRTSRLWLALVTSAVLMAIQASPALADSEPLPPKVQSGGPSAMIIVGLAVTALVLVSVVVLRRLTLSRRVARPEQDTNGGVTQTAQAEGRPPEGSR